MTTAMPELASPCTWCHAPAGAQCTGQKGRRHPRSHPSRRWTWAITTSVCPRYTCDTAPGTPCRTPDGYQLHDAIHPEREAAARQTAAQAARTTGPRTDQYDQQTLIPLHDPGTDTPEGHPR